MSSIYLILTVGTGTPGPESSLVDGLRTTIKMVKPLKFWLIPSLSEDSVATADLIREGMENFAPWNESSTYLQINKVDSLENCRQTVRKAIRQAKASLKKSDRLIVNPTSGTKQMSAGATIAALDENIGEIVFTIGERSQGIVKTGTEKLETFEAHDYFADRDFLTASELYAAGSHQAAADLLRKYPERFAAEEALCRCVQQWEALNYNEALRIAETKRHPLFEKFLHHLRPLLEATRSKRLDARVGGDILKSAYRLHARGRYEDALFRSCKAFEILSHHELHSLTALTPPYAGHELLEKVELPYKIKARINNSTAKLIHFGIQEVLSILKHNGTNIGELSTHRDISKMIEIRNQLAHSTRAVTKDESNMAYNTVSHIYKQIGGPIPVNITTELTNV